MKLSLIVVFASLIGMHGCSSHHYKVSEGFVSFYLKNKEAKTVEFLYSIDDFRGHPAYKIKEGTWEIRVPVEKEFSYFYLVDGKMFVPECTMKEMDDFGHENCLFTQDM